MINQNKDICVEFIEYIGHRKAYDVLVQELHRLEYRGYDSASVAVMKHGSIALIDHDMPTVDIAPQLLSP